MRQLLHEVVSIPLGSNAHRCDDVMIGISFSSRVKNPETVYAVRAYVRLAPKRPPTNEALIALAIARSYPCLFALSHDVSMSLEQLLRTLIF